MNERLVFDWLNEIAESPEGQRGLETTDAVIDFGLAIDALLQARGMTRSDLARSLGVHRSVVTRRLASGSDIRLSSVVEMLHALGINMSDYFKEVAAGAQRSGVAASASPMLMAGEGQGGLEEGGWSNVIPIRRRSTWQERQPVRVHAA